MKTLPTSLALMRGQALQWLIDLATEEGINASAKDEVYGCIFGRDSALTILKILRTHIKNPSLTLLEITRRALLTLVSLQGKQFNIESGEEPGKFIHEFRKDKYEHLISRKIPWFVYPDGLLRNYDSIDSTPLTLIALYKYFQITGDSEFLVSVLPAVEAGLNWIITYGDSDKDLFLEYNFPESRKYGGLLVQSWTDSHESIMRKDGKMPKYPIAPVEAQAYAWLALKLWADYYAFQHPTFAAKLRSQARKLKIQFNKKFIFKDGNYFFAAQALDGDKNQIQTITGNPLICLWATYEENGRKECIVKKEYLREFVNRGFEEDMFEKNAGIRTMSKKSDTFNPSQNSYHNGSFWPILNSLIYEGLETWGFIEQAKGLKEASLKPIEYFGYPIELYITTDEGSYLEYKNQAGQTSCKYQAWSAAATLDFLT